MSPVRKMIYNDFYCTQCGQRFRLPRDKSKRRASGHLKKIWCCTCQKKQNFVECNDIAYSKSDFMEEFISGNFSTDGLRKNKS